MTESTRQEQKERTRRHLIETAFRQFAKDGLLATKTSDIAIAAGVAHGTVFVHFPTKEDLLITVIHEFGQRITERIHELVAGGGTIRAVLGAHLNGLIEYEPFYARLVTEGQLLPAEARNSLVMIQSAISFHLNQVAKQEMAAGEVRQIPLHLLFNTWIGLIHYYLANGDMFSPGESVLKRYGQDLLQYYISLITPTS